MLTVDLVGARRRGDELRITKLAGAVRQRAALLAERLTDAIRNRIGESRAGLHQRLEAVPAAPTDKRLRSGFIKLLEDDCVFSAETELDPIELRREIFLRASVARGKLAEGEELDREGLLAEFADERKLDGERLERSLYADLRAEHVLLEAPTISGEELLVRYEAARSQAVLLRATRVTVDVACRRPAAYRALFRKLKFRQLLFTIRPLEKEGYRIEIDGPYSLFGSVTRYGLGLAQLLPAIQACDRYKLTAEVLWGPARTPLQFTLQAARAKPDETDETPRDDVAELQELFKHRAGPWRLRQSRAVLNLPGVGLCVPDLEAIHQPTGRRLYLEVLGFWSREAVWKRVELVEAGLPDPILFAVRHKLRVSEEVLDDEQPSALYVYRTKMSAAAVERKLEQLLERATARQ